MKFEVATTDDEFAQLKNGWEALDSNPLKSFAWNFSWWVRFGEGRELLLFSMFENNKLVGVAPLFVDKWLGQDRLRFLGSGSTCTDYASIIAVPEYRESFIEQIADYVSFNAKLSLIEFEGVVPDDDQFLRSRLNANSYWQYSSELEPTWILDLPESWEGFVKNSKKSLKRKIKKAESRLASDEFNVASTLDEMEFDEAFKILVELHQDRFTNKGEPGVFKDERFTKFLHSAASDLVSQDRAEILVAFENDLPIIAQLYLLDESGPQLYQAGIRTDSMKSEPGHLMFTFVVKKAIQLGYKTFDFLRGNEPYKPFWGAQMQPLHKIRCVSNRLVPSTINKSFQLLRSAKHFVAAVASKASTAKA